MALSENLMLARKAKGYTTEDIANKVNVGKQAIGKYESGIRVPNGIILVEIAEVLGTTAEALVKGKAENFLPENSNN